MNDTKHSMSQKLNPQTEDPGFYKDKRIRLPTCIWGLASISNKLTPTPQWNDGDMFAQWRVHKCFKINHFG